MDTESMDTEIIDHATGLTDEEVEHGRAWALVSWASMLTGLPLFIGPLILRNNDFAIQHAKWAGAAYIGFVGVFVTGSLITGIISLFTCGLLSPSLSLSLLGLLFFIPAFQGVVAAAKGRLDEPLGLGELSDLLFDRVDWRSDLDD